MVPHTDFLNFNSLKLKNSFDNDFKHIITYSLINNKVYQAYMNCTIYLKPYHERSECLKNSNHAIEYSNVTLERILACMANEVVKTILKSAEFLRKAPGFDNLSPVNFEKLIKRGTMDYHVITMSEFFVDGESCMVFENDVHCSRSWLNKLRGKQKTDLKFEAAESLNELKLTDREKSMVCVYMYSQPGLFSHFFTFKF